VVLYISHRVKQAIAREDEERMEKRIRTNLLFDLYGRLITDKRSQALRLYLEEDLSLSEIAEATGVSRQAVHDGILRAEAKLEEYERALGLLEKRERRAAAVERAIEALDKGRNAEARGILAALLESEE